MKPAANTLLALILALILSACGGSTANSGAADTSAATGGDGLSLSVQESQEDSAPASPGAVEEGEIAPQPGQNAKLIRRAELYIQTEAFDEASAALEKLVAERGGYFQSAQVEGGSLRNQNAQRYGEYVIRLPQERFEDFLAQSGSLGYVVRQQESSENVSQAYYDTQTRLETQRTKQERLLALLAQADTMEAILELEDALSDVEYEIQSLSFHRSGALRRPGGLRHGHPDPGGGGRHHHPARGDGGTAGADGSRDFGQLPGVRFGGPGPAGVAVLPPVPGGGGGVDRPGGRLVLAEKVPEEEWPPGGRSGVNSILQRCPAAGAVKRDRSRRFSAPT